MIFSPVQVLGSGSEEVCKVTDQAFPVQGAGPVLWEVLCGGWALCIFTGRSRGEKLRCVQLLSPFFESILHVILITVTVLRFYLDLSHQLQFSLKSFSLECV